MTTPMRFGVGFGNVNGGNVANVQYALYDKTGTVLTGFTFTNTGVTEDAQDVGYYWTPDVPMDPTWAYPVRVNFKIVGTSPLIQSTESVPLWKVAAQIGVPAVAPNSAGGIATVGETGGLLDATDAATLWNALTSGMTTAGSIGILLKQLRFTIANQVDANALSGGGGGGGGGTVATGTAQAGSGTSTLHLASSDSAGDNFYFACLVTITAGTGAGQTRVVLGNVNSTKLVTVDYPWAVVPDGTSVYALLFSHQISVGALGTAQVDLTQRYDQVSYAKGSLGHWLMKGWATLFGKSVGNSGTNSVDRYKPDDVTINHTDHFDNVAAPSTRNSGGTT